MRTLKFILITFATVLFLCSCKKDENGTWATYYTNKTVESYVYTAETKIPIPNFRMHIVAYSSGMWTGLHVNYCYTDENGKYTFKLAKHVKGVYEVYSWGIGAGGQDAPNSYCNWVTLSKDDIKGRIIKIDTFFVSKEILNSIKY